jgi:hypothetical protein
MCGPRVQRASLAALPAAQAHVRDTLAQPWLMKSQHVRRTRAARVYAHRAALAALLAVGAVLAMDAANAFLLSWLTCAPCCAAGPEGTASCCGNLTPLPRLPKCRPWASLCMQPCCSQLPHIVAFAPNFSCNRPGLPACSHARQQAAHQSSGPRRARSFGDYGSKPTHTLSL